MKLSGMDADAVESAASNLHRASGDLQGTAGRISAAVGEAVGAWDGPDAKRFQELWEGTYRAAITRAAGVLEDLSRAARENARAQREVSER